MSITSLFGLAERLFNGVDNTNATSHRPHQHDRQIPQQKVSNQLDQNSGNNDRFTPSSASNPNNPGDNVIALQFERLRFSSFNIAAIPAAAPAANAPANGNTTPANVPTAVSAPLTVQGAAPAVSAAATGAPADSTATQALLQALNVQLNALGLTPSEIQAFDEAAKLIQQFSPAAYQDLVNQLKALAGQFASQSAPTTTTGTGASTAQGTGTGGFQLTELSLRFTRVNETVQSAGTGGAGTTTQVSAYKLQLKEVQVSLNSPAGQTVQLQAPQLNPAKVKAATVGAAS